MIIDLHEKNLQAMQRLIESLDYKVIGIVSEEELNIVLKSHPFDLVLVNTSTEFIYIDDICAFIRGHDGSSEAAVIFISQDQGSTKEVVNCFDAGGNDYLKKPIIQEELIARIRFHLAQKQKLHEYSNRYEKLASIAAIDHVSKVSSKLQLQMLLRQQIELFTRYDENISIVYLCIMELKKINTILGHRKCDKLIFNFAKMLKDNIRASDEVGRWIGGDFVLLLPKTNAREAFILATKLNFIIKKDELLSKFALNCSFGITQIASEDTVISVIERGRKAMHKAAENENTFIEVC